MRRRNRINGQFAARRIEMLESPAYRVLSRSGHMIISRVEIELAAHGGNDNGRLPVTTEDFVEYGMHRTSVAPAIREADALGLIRVTERGRAGNAEHRSPNLFYLTYAHHRDSRKHPPTDEWRSIQTLQEANQIACAARANKNELAVERGKRSWRKRQKKRVPVRKTLVFRCRIPVSKHPSPRFGISVLLGQVEIPNYYLYFWMGSTATNS